MIKCCRPDPGIDAFCSLLGRALAGADEGPRRLQSLGGRPIHLTPSGRDGLRWLLRAAGIGEGDEVALPALNCESIPDVIAAAGAKLVIFGNDPADFSPSLASCRAALGPAVKVVVLPHLYGIPADLAGFAELCRERKLLLIEDCAHCVRGTADGREVGSVGDAAIFSFSYDKPLSLGWGGALSLSPALAASLPPPAFPPMAEAEDRLVAAAFVVQHCMTDAALYERFLSVGYSLWQLLRHRELVPEVLKIVRRADAATALPLWCREHMRPPMAGGARLFSRARRLASRVLSRALRPFAGPTRGGSDPIRTAMGGVAPAPGGLAMRLLAAQDGLTRDCRGWERRRRIAGIYLGGLDRKRLVVPVPPRPPACWLRFPLAWRCRARERDQRCREISAALKVEIGPFNWAAPLHRLPRFRSAARVGPGVDETAALMDGLVNLPVHSQVSEELAAELVERINAAAAG